MQEYYKESVKTYYENVIVWVCGCFSLVVFLTILSLIYAQNNLRRNEDHGKSTDDTEILTQNMETENIPTQ